jgi:ubiquinone/menaquinone biosynthesis C-methylase UbiE
MNSALKFPKLFYRTLKLRFSSLTSNPTADYDVAATEYDAYYSKYLGVKALEMLGNVPIQTGQNIIDLACGTGFFTHRIAEKVGNLGQVVAVDISSGMLQCNQKNAADKTLSNISFVESDAIAFIKQLPDNSVDGIICGWGVCYLNHHCFRQEVERVVKSGGFLALIENRANTLKAVSDLFTKALLDYPEALIKKMIIHLPKDSNYLVKTFCQGKIKAVDAWDGEVQVPCQNGAEIAEYMVKSGASAGFLDALDKDLRPQVLQSLVNYADANFTNGKDIKVIHNYSVLIAKLQ